jgi:hypothetical protein
MARYMCPDCKTKSDQVASRAEAASLLEIHRRYFCALGRAAHGVRRAGRR